MLPAIDNKKSDTKLGLWKYGTTSRKQIQIIFLTGLVIVLFSLEMAVIRPVDFQGNTKHLYHSLLFQVSAILMASVLAFMILTTFDLWSKLSFGLNLTLKFP